MMAQICAAVCASHSPFLYALPDEWEDARAVRANHGGIDPVVPIDSAATNAAKFARCDRAFRRLRDELTAARPDLLVIFGDDQREQFDFANFPAFGVFCGAEFAGYRVSERIGLPVPGRSRGIHPRTPEHWRTVRADPAFARELTTRLLARGFDLAFSLQLPRPDSGIGHAFMRPLEHLTPDGNPAVIPFFVNCYYGPQPLARRCAQLGRAIRAAIEAMPGTQRVALIGSGGLWHTPMAPHSILDEEFDRSILAHLRTGAAEPLAQFFDAAADRGESSQRAQADGGTGMVLGLGGGTGEIRNWIVTAAAMEGIGAAVVDYVPIYASPVGAAFAYWKVP
jgi:hypothetical protein